MKTKTAGEPLKWERVRVQLPEPEVHELFGDEALRQWLAAHTQLYKDRDERAFAETAASPLL